MNFSLKKHHENWKLVYVHLQVKPVPITYISYDLQGKQNPAFTSVITQNRKKLNSSLEQINNSYRYFKKDKLQIFTKQIVNKKIENYNYFGFRISHRIYNDEYMK